MALYKIQKQLAVTAGAYSANDVIGGQIQFVGIRRCNLKRAILVSETAVNLDFYLILYDAVQTNIADNAAMNPVQADAAKVIGSVYFRATTDRIAFGTGEMYEVQQDEIG